jgi:hypothetical protein
LFFDPQHAGSFNPSLDKPRPASDNRAIGESARGNRTENNSPDDPRLPTPSSRSAQDGLKGEKGAAAGDRREAKLALSQQLFDNLLVLARLHKRDPDQATLYFNQSLLEDAQRADENLTSGEG